MALESLGELLLVEMARACVIEDPRCSQHWAGAQAARVAERLNLYRVHCAPLRPVVFWSSRVTAFTLPGPYIFISRELLQRLPSDAAVAFVLAHEMAHHDLRHLGEPSSSRRVSVLREAWDTAKRLSRRPEDELDADRYALQLCAQAGYQAAECLEAFRILIAHSIDWGDVDGVFGLFDEERQDGPAPTARVWWWQRRRGYRCLHERRERLARAALAQSDRTASPSPSPFRTAGVGVPDTVRCASCGRTPVRQVGDLCATCLRRTGFNRRVARLVRQERLSALLENWKWPLLIAAVILVALVARAVWMAAVR